MNTTSTTAPRIAPPSRLLQLLELRASWELAAGVAALPWLRLAPRGDGHPVLVLPGLVASDRSTHLLRAFLTRRGYEVHGWGLGRNYGPRPSVEEAMLATIDRLHAKSGRKVSLIGQSLGGAYARLLAAQRPDAVRCVITLGSPISGHPRSSTAWRIYEFTSGESSVDPRRWQQVTQTPRVPTTAIYSRSDGVVAWRNSVETSGAHTESIEVVSSHMGMAVHPAVLYAVAERLAQPEGQWQPFERCGWRAAVYPRPSSPK
ncbi:esterase/lipase family protein [Piscinibacter sp.]|uniref:esterase/lipase family protein n=1 Tax=Piscinibacter sp. TaxID=1903157 RepID=UPI002F42040D